MEDFPIAQSPGASLPPSAPAAPGYTDRGSLLIFFGVVQIALGALCALMIPFMLLGLVMASRVGTPSAPFLTHVLGGATYLALAVTFIWLGIGSIQARRWARALTLIASWIGLIGGILIIVVMTAILPTSFLAGMRAASAQNPHGAGFSTGVAAVILTFMIVFFAIFFILVPLAFVIFYSRRDVAETCKHRDPVERWTDRCPLPVLAVSVLFAVGAAYFLLMTMATPIVPFFGRYLTGFPARFAFIFFAALDGYLAWSFFRLQPAGWWVAITTLPLRIVSMAITYWRADLFQAYEKLGWSSNYVQVLRHNPLLRSGLAQWGGLGFSLILVAYLLFLKRYFNRLPPQPSDPERAGKTISQQLN